MYLGDIRLGATLDFKFTSRQFSTGAPFTLSGTPSVAAYPGNSTTELTAGITVTADFDGRTGLNHLRVAATSGNGYATATEYTLVVTAGTVDGVSVAGEVVGTFSIEKRSALMPTTDGRTLAVGTSGDITLADGAITAAKIAADAITAATIASDAVAEIQSGLATAAALATVDTVVDTIQAKTDALPSDPADQSLIVDATSAILARLGAPAGASVSADMAAVKSQTAAIETDTQDLQNRVPSALVGGRIDANVGAINNTGVTGDGDGTPWGPA